MSCWRRRGGRRRSQPPPRRRGKFGARNAARAARCASRAIVSPALKSAPWGRLRFGAVRDFVVVPAANDAARPSMPARVLACIWLPRRHAAACATHLRGRTRGGAQCARRCGDWPRHAARCQARPLIKVHRLSQPCAALEQAPSSAGQFLGNVSPRPADARVTKRRVRPGSSSASVAAARCAVAG